MQSIKPVGSRVLLAAIEQKEEKVGELFIPKGASGRGDVAKAVVVAVGNKDIPEGVVVDAVVLVPYLDRQITADGKKFYLMNAEDIIGVVEG